MAERTGNAEIYVVRPDGTHVRRLTYTKGDVDRFGDDSWPTWSPDGTRIAFTSNRTGGGEIWIMRAGGSRQRRIAGPPKRDDWAPSFSPDGSQIASIHSPLWGGGGCTSFGRAATGCATSTCVAKTRPGVHGDSLDRRIQ